MADTTAGHSMREPGAEGPTWARSSVREDGGFTHERISDRHPMVLTWVDDGVTVVRPSDLSLSVSDHRIGERWVRSEPTVQIEGGSYPLEDAAQLCLAVQELVARGTTPDYS